MADLIAVRHARERGAATLLRWSEQRRPNAKVYGDSLRPQVATHGSLPRAANDAHRHGLDAVEQVRAQAPGRADELEPDVARNDLLEQDRHLEPRQERTEA